MASDPCAGCHQYDSTEARNAACADMVPWNAAPPSPTSPTPFLTKTYELVDDPDTDSVISWSNEGTSFVIWNPADLCQRLLPRYFKHSNFASFVRQLNTYGFHKITSDRWEFANVEFKRGQRQLLRGIHRRRPSTMSQPPGLLQADCARSTMFLSCSNMAELCKFDEEEKERLKKDRKKLIKELWSLQQKLQSTMGDLQTMWERLQKGETSLRHTVSFISKAINDPDFLAHITENSSTATELANTVPKKRQLEDIVDDQSALGGIHCSCKNATCAGQHYRISAKSMDTELSMRVKANWNEMCSVDPAPLKTLDELVADAKLMRSAAMNNNDIPYSRSFMTECAHRHCATDGPLSRQNPDKCYQAVYTCPTRRYGHLTARDTCTTSDRANDLTYNVASP